MRRFLFDTAPLTACLFARPIAQTLFRSWVAAEEVATSHVVYGETVEYLRGRADFVIRRNDLRVLLRSIKPYQLTNAVLERYGELRRLLRPPSGPGLIGDMDTLIAATALERRLTLVTTDSDFARVPGLSLQLIDPHQLRSTS